MKTIVEVPNLYDLLYQDVTEDINMYIKLLQPYKEILEFGAGTGRITIPLAKNGHYIEAVDLSSEMLEGLKIKIASNNLNKKITPICADMCGYKTKKEFDAVIIPLTSFNYLLTEEEQLSCLKSVRESLKKSGIGIIELLSKKTFLDVNNSDDLSFVKRIVINEEEFYDYYRITKLDISERKITQNRVFKYYKKNVLLSEEEFIWNNRFVTIEDFMILLEKAGLVIDKIYGNCKLDDFVEDSEDVFVKVRRK